MANAAQGQSAAAPAPVPVSVVIPCRNGARYLAAAVQSALAQVPPPLEVLVVDDASTDDSAAIAAAFGPPVRVIRNATRLERSASRNRGIAEARGTWVAFLDADDLWLPGKLARQLNAVAAAPAPLTLVYGQARRFEDRDGVHVPQAPFGMSVAGPHPLRGLLCYNAVPLLTVMARKAALTEAGGFDAALPCRYAEDYDLWLRLALRGRFLFVPEPLALYRVHAAQTCADQRLMRTANHCVRRRFLRSVGATLDRETRRVADYTRLAEAAATALRLGRRRVYRRCCLRLLGITSPRYKLQWLGRWLVPPPPPSRAESF